MVEVRFLFGTLPALGLRAELCRLQEVRVEMYGRKFEEMERGNDFFVITGLRGKSIS